ncbi:hypothetical protein OG21DRAFT_1497392 [Imleria badia]|nr:hypothetical protein OG21DRAFT_1497392 [Imleria badia]
MYTLSLLLPLFCSLKLVAGHASIWHPSMWGFNVSQETFSYDNRPVVPLAQMPFNEWWFHNHLAYPPNPGDVFELPAGQNATLQIACNKGATTYYASSEGGNIQEPNDPNNVCPGSPISEFHTTGIDDVKGCGLGIAYKSNVSEIQPADFTIFSINQTCVWNRYTNFGVPERMPSCPNGQCTCAFFWIHSTDSGGEQMYMNGFRCNVSNSNSNVPLATPKVARRCGADPANGKPNAAPGNCTYGAKQPLYWLQAEQNNMFEGYYSPPFYNSLYNFQDGAQNDIFQDSYSSIPVPGPNQTALPVLATPGTTTAPTASGGSSTTSTQTSTVSGSSSTTPSSTGSVSVTSPSATPSGATCPSTGGASPPSRRHVPVERRTPFTHKLPGMTRHSRRLNPEKRLDLWKPY